MFNISCILVPYLGNLFTKWCIITKTTFKGWTVTPYAEVSPLSSAYTSVNDLDGNSTFGRFHCIEMGTFVDIRRYVLPSSSGLEYSVWMFMLYRLVIQQTCRGEGWGRRITFVCGQHLYGWPLGKSTCQWVFGSYDGPQKGIGNVVHFHMMKIPKSRITSRANHHESLKSEVLRILTERDRNSSLPLHICFMFN